MSFDKPLYNSRIINSFVQLIRKKYQQVDVNELLRYAGMQPYEVTDEGHWFTQKQIDLFHDRLYEVLGRDISREAGRFAASDESLGLAAKYILGMMGPVAVFNALAKSTPRFTKSSVYTTRKITGNKVEVTVRPHAWSQEKQFQCENRMGFFEAIFMMFGHSLPEIQHPDCVFRGGDCCRYVISWKKSLLAQLKSVRNMLVPVLLASFAIILQMFDFEEATSMMAMPAFLLLAFNFAVERLEKKELTEALVNLKETSQNLVEEVEANYNNARMVNEVGQAISRQRDIDEVLDDVIRALENRLRYDRCLILLADAHKSKLDFRTGFGFSDRQLAALQETSFNLADLQSKGVFVVSFREQKPILVNDFSEISRIDITESGSSPDIMQAQSFICCPIVCEGESLGVLAVDNVKSKRKLVQSDMSLLMGIAPVIGISIRNAMYIERELRLAEQLRHSQKMEAVGQLAGGIAHDFNNLLTAIIGYTHLAQMSAAPDDGAQTFLEQVEFAADRAAHLTEGLLAFSRKQLNDPKPVDLNLVVTTIEKLLMRLVTAEIELNIRMCADCLHVMADASQIEQVLMNLITNARDAMNGSGVLTVTTGVVELGEPFLAEHGYGAVGRYAVLSVTDTGAGMDEETKARIFEPFYTTKEIGKGTGLGMAIVYGIVQQHEGYLDTETELGVGTTFRIYLPLLEKDVINSVGADETADVCGGSETVLIAEDAPEVRKLTAEVLKQSGYRVIEAEDGQDAVDKFTASESAVDLVIIDVVMPKMNGKEAFSRIASIKPDTKVLFTSGYTPDDARRRGATFAKENFLAKPSSPQALLKKVREVLAA